MQELPRLLYRADEAARVLGLSRAKVYRLIADGTLPSITIGRSRRLKRSDLEEWAARQPSGVSRGGNGAAEAADEAAVERETAVSAAG